MDRKEEKGLEEVERLNNKKEIIRNKSKRYKKERKEILDKVLKIIGLEERDYFYSHLINSSEEIERELLGLTEDIMKYYATSTWSAFKRIEVVENKALSLIKSLLRENNINLTAKQERIQIENKMINTTLYKIENEI